MAGRLHNPQPHTHAHTHARRSQSPRPPHTIHHINPTPLPHPPCQPQAAPWSKTGGLGDVVGSLPAALAARGHRVMVVAPRYADYEDTADTGVRAGVCW